MKMFQKMFVLTATVMILGAGAQAMAAGETNHVTPTHGQDTRMGRTTGNDTITDGTFSEPTVTIHEGDEIRRPSSTTSAVEKFNKQ